MPKVMSKVDVLELINEYPNFILVKDYIKNHIRTLEIECKACNNIWTVNFYQFMHKSKKCPICSNKEKAYSYEYIREFIGKSGYMLESTQYINNAKRLKILDRDGYMYYMSFRSFRGRLMDGFNFSRFYNGNIYTKENIRNWARKNGCDFEILHINITGSRKKDLVLKCKTCNHIWNSSWDIIHSGRSCPACPLSVGEKRITRFLIDNSFAFIPQKRFPDCKNTYALPFDFYLPDYNCVIEYHGRQHYEPVDFSGKGVDFAKKEFDGVKKRDAIKMNYCRENKINSMIISNWEFRNIESILREKLLKEGENEII